MKKFNEKKISLYEDIDETNDIEYLETLIQYIEDDIQNLDKQSTKTLELRAKMSGLTLEEFLEKTKSSLLDRKKYAEDKLNKLKDNGMDNFINPYPSNGLT